MESDNLNLVRQILSSRIFQNSSAEEQQNVIVQIQEAGISLESIQQIQNELEDQQNQLNGLEPRQSLDVANAAQYLQTLPYDVFVNIVIAGDIKGQNLINLCSTSPKFREYCNRELVLPNGQVLNKYLFRQLVADMGFELQPNDDPREFYILASKYKPFSTVALLELVCQIMQNKLHATNDQLSMNNLHDFLITQFPGLIVSPRIMTKVLRPLIDLGWISNGRGEHPFTPLNDSGRQLDLFRNQFLQYIIDNFDWLANQNLWPPVRKPVDRYTYGPDNGSGHDRIFIGTGFNFSRQANSYATFQDRIDAIVTLLTLSQRAL